MSGRAHIWTGFCCFQSLALSYWTAFLKYKWEHMNISLSIYISPDIPFIQWELLNQYLPVDEDPSLMFQLRWCGCQFSGFRLSWHFTSCMMNVVLLLTILALLKCFKNVPFLTSRGDLPKCQSELIWMIFIAVPQGLELLACCFCMSYFDGR